MPLLALTTDAELPIQADVYLRNQLIFFLSFADRREEISRSSLTWKDLLWTPWWSVRSGSLLRTMRWCTCNPTPRCGRTGWTWWCPWRLGWGKTPGGWGWFNQLTFKSHHFPTRYVGIGDHQVGVRVEGVSMFDSGNWSLSMMNKNISVVSTSFQVVVTEEPHLVTDTVFPVEVEVWENI